MSEFYRLSEYRIMWLFVFFDLPTEKAKHKKAYIRFRRGLLQDGFTMHQYSVYIRHCASRESMEVHVKRLESIMPDEGKISIMEVTDKQFGRIKHYFGKEPKPPPETPKQLEFF